MKYLLFVLALAAFACQKAEKEIQEDHNEAVLIPEHTIDTTSIMKHINILASDEFEGRFPATIGEEKTIEYLTSEMKKLGIKPANGDSYTQSFDITQMLSTPNETITISGNDKRIQLKWKDEFVAQTRKPEENISIKDAELVFCGYGITAPEYNWDDFAGMDMSNKIAVVFVNDPGFATQDDKLFTGNNMTYYGRWSYKYEEAARQNCLGIMIIHENEAAGYEWEVVRNGWTGTEMVVMNENNNSDLASFEGWFNKDKASQIFEAAGYSFDDMKAAALKDDFAPIPLGMKMNLDITLESKPSSTNNILGMIEGSKTPDEYIIYMGHWDHYGVDESLEGDQILNGARDNASGCGGILEIAESFIKSGEQPERSVVFMFTGGEEQGLLGSKYYSSNPLFPLNKTALCINIDGLNIWGRMKDLVQIGRGQSPDLDNLMDKYAKVQDRIITKDKQGEKGYFYRSDHFSLAKKGVPSIYTHMGYDHRELGPEEGEKMVKAWTKDVYHKPNDEVEGWWTLEGAIEDLAIFYAIGKEVANSDIFPAWSEKSEFREIREESMSKQ